MAATPYSYHDNTRFICETGELLNSDVLVCIVPGLYSNASAFALVSANAAFAFALAFDCPEVGAFAFALAFESKTFAFALAFDSNAFDWIQMPFKCQSNAT